MQSTRGLQFTLFYNEVGKVDNKPSGLSYLLYILLKHTNAIVHVFISTVTVICCFRFTEAVQYFCKYFIYSFGSDSERGHVVSALATELQLWLAFLA